MALAGYVYALINPSFEGMVKVGKTSKHPEERAKELSSSPGVPTPFSVAYKIFVDDCTSVEQYIHEYLEHKGHRVSDNREFFNAPLEDVIDAMLMARDHAPQYIEKNDLNFESNELNDKYNDKMNFAEELSDEADEYFYGEEDKLQDYEKALELHKKAADMGNLFSYFKISSMYLGGLGCKKDINKSISYAKKGMELGSLECAAKLANIYAFYGLQYRIQHIGNAKKCWDYFFNNEYFEHEYPNDMKVLHGCHYIKTLYITRYHEGNITKEVLPIEHIDKIVHLKDKVLEETEKVDNVLKLDGHLIKFARKLLDNYDEEIIEDKSEKTDKTE